jgi:hypothetical protein
MGGKPKTPKPTAQELELQRNQRDETNDLARDRNSSLKALKRTLGGRRGLLGSGSELGIGGRSPGGGGSNGSGLGIRGGGGGLLSSGGGGGGGGGAAGGGGVRRGGARAGFAARGGQLP